MPNLDMIRTASCRCGRLTARCEGEPVRISVCHCLECKQRSGSAFSAQARWPDERITLSGEATVWSVKGEGGTGTFSFCPVCGGAGWFVIDRMPGHVAIPIGNFADPNFPPPEYSVYEDRKHAWVEIVGEDVERYS